MTKFPLSSVPEFVSNFQLVVSSFLVQSNGSLGAHRCYRASIVQEVGNLPSVARLRASNEVRYVCCSSARCRRRIAALSRQNAACYYWLYEPTAAAPKRRRSRRQATQWQLNLLKFSPGYKDVRDFRME